MEYRTKFDFYDLVVDTLLDLIEIINTYPDIF